MNPNVNKVIIALSTKNDINNGHDIIAASMEILDTFEGFTGGLKSQTVNDVIIEIITNNSLNFNQNIINNLKIINDNGLLQQTIDIIHKAASGTLNISSIVRPSTTFYYTQNSGPNIFAMRSFISN